MSLGGYYAPRAAAYEPRLRSVAGISGPFNMGELWDDLPPMTRETFIRKSHSRDDDERRARALRRSTSTACSSTSTARRCSSPATSTG